MIRILMSVILVASSYVTAWDVSEVENIGPETVYAIIHIESSGDACAHRNGSQYWGLLQISDAYMMDAVGIPNSELLHCDGERSLEVFSEYMQRYSFLHEWDPGLLAILHKSGPETATIVKNRIDNGVPIEEAVQDTPVAVADYWELFVNLRQEYAEN